MKTIRDRQRSKCYAWEEVHVAPFDHSPIPFDTVQMVVDHVWKMEGLKYPPRVEPMPKQKHASGDATRLTVRFRERTFTWIVLHELAHSLSSTAISEEHLTAGETNAHGAIFLGLYIQLLSHYLKLDFGELVKSAEAAGLKVKQDARPVFLGP